jgi:predicted nucleic acid-binding protein
VTGPAVVAEYREVVRRPKFHRYGFPPRWLEFVIEESLWLQNPEPWVYAHPDPKDAPFLALAHAAGAWLVTGNLKHFPETVRSGVSMLSPADYLAHLVGE